MSVTDPLIHVIIFFEVSENFGAMEALLAVLLAFASAHERSTHRGVLEVKPSFSELVSVNRYETFIFWFKQRPFVRDSQNDDRTVDLS